MRNISDVKASKRYQEGTIKRMNYENQFLVKDALHPDQSPKSKERRWLSFKAKIKLEDIIEQTKNPDYVSSGY